MDVLERLSREDDPPWVSGWHRPEGRRSRPRGRRLVVGVAVAALALVGLGAVGASWLNDDSPQSAAAVEDSEPAGASEVASADGFAAVYETVEDGVGQVQVDGCDGGDFTGTAFLVRPRLMATAYHVVEDAVDIRVEIDGTVVDAEVDRADPATDLALLRLESRVDGHVFSFASRDPMPGTRVAAIGYPLDEPRTLTEGTISGLDRSVDTESGTFDGMLQTDTAINPGNSGGPLIDLSGQVVGVADAIRNNAQGIGFAVPASIAADVLRGPVESRPFDGCS